MFGFVRVAGTSRADNGVANRGYPQVRRDFRRAAETARPLRFREADHREFVSRTTRRAAPPATMATREGPKPQRPAPKRQHTRHRSLPDYRDAPCTLSADASPNRTAPQYVSVIQRVCGACAPPTAQHCQSLPLRSRSCYIPTSFSDRVPNRVDSQATA